MNIGEVSEASGLPVKTTPYHEDFQLVRPAGCANGYREIAGQEANMPAFLARARSLGFSIEESRSLVSLYEDRASAEVKLVAAEHLDRIGRKIEALEALRGKLQTLVARCHGDGRPRCPILDDLAGQKTAAA